MSSNTCLGDLASVIRSKNAGPFQITIDVMFADAAIYRHVLDAKVLTALAVARRYGIGEADVDIIAFDRVFAIKITIPRRWGNRGSGSAGDRDVYGAQQHGPLLDLTVP
jgi:hypothetical protein